MRHTFHTAENALGTLESLRDKTDAFLAAIRPDLSEALKVGGSSDLDGELAYLRETIVEHFRAQLGDAFEAVSERWDVDPMGGVDMSRRAA